MKPDSASEHEPEKKATVEANGANKRETSSSADSAGPEQNNAPHLLKQLRARLRSGSRQRPEQGLPGAPPEPLLAEQAAALEGQGTSEDVFENAARWLRRFLIPLVILAWAGVALLTLWLAGHVARTLLMLVIAALLAYALSPAVTLFARVMPRVLAVLLVYLLILGGLAALIYFVIRTAVEQLLSLSHYVQFLLTPGAQGQPTPLEHILSSFGISQEQITTLRGQLVGQLEGVAGNVIPVVSGIIGAILDLVLIAVISIYLVLEGNKTTRWLRRNMPWSQRGRVRFTVETMQRIVGGYIRGQLVLCTLIGVLVGVGMTILGVPYALLLGVLAFLLEFIPVLGTMVSGMVCVLLALTKGWLIALIVLAYFVGVHVLEGDVIGPRIVGKTIGLHPVVSLLALIAGSELFGIWGALFAAPVAGLLQAVLLALWTEWRASHPQEFHAAPPAAKTSRNEEAEALSSPEPEPEPPPTLLS